MGLNGYIWDVFGYSLFFAYLKTTHCIQIYQFSLFLYAHYSSIHFFIVNILDVLGHSLDAFGYSVYYYLLNREYPSINSINVFFSLIFYVPHFNIHFFTVNILDVLGRSLDAFGYFTVSTSPPCRNDIS